MTRRELLALAATATVLRAQRSSASVGAARDLMYQALELLSGHATPDQVTRAVRFLRASLDEYPSFGDAHYYRALCLKRLNQDAALQRSELRAAENYNSEALRDMRDPFFLAVPKIDRDLAVMGQKWALVVGISQFGSPRRIPTLPAASDDAKAFADLLKDPAAGRFPTDQVILLRDTEATTVAIKANLNAISTKAKPEDVVVMYFSTHGSKRNDDLRQVSYLYTYDTDATDKNQIFATALAMIEVSGMLNSRCLAQRTVIIFDTCHSGAGVQAQSLTAADIDKFREGAGRYVLTACQDDQQAYEDGGHGYFTQSLIEHLRARKGCVRMNDLFAEVKNDVTAKVKGKYGASQNPVMAASQNSAEFALGAAPAGPSANCAVA